MDCILLLGEGNFSYSHELINSDKFLICTTNESYETTINKYKNNALKNIRVLSKCNNVKILYNIDATYINHPFILRNNIIKIVFNFPHLEFPGKDASLQHNNLLDGLFKEANKLLAKNGSLEISLFLSLKYRLWDLIGKYGLHLNAVNIINWSTFTYYNHCTTKLVKNRYELNDGYYNRLAATWIFSKNYKDKIEMPKEIDDFNDLINNIYYCDICDKNINDSIYGDHKNSKSHRNNAWNELLKNKKQSII